MEIHDEWPVGERRYLSEASMARINARRTEPSQEVSIAELLAS